MKIKKAKEDLMKGLPVKSGIVKSDIISGKVHQGAT
jgi:hypothetical protein